MINFKDRDEIPTSAIIVGSIVIMLGAGLFTLFAPKPKPTLTDKQVHSQLVKAKIGLSKAQKNIDQAKATLASRTWQGSPEEVLPLALQKVTAFAQNNHLKIVGFHPQNLVNAPNITLIPCVVNVDGPFANVVAFTKSLEADSSNLCVNLMQIASAEQESNKVTASIGIVAYQPVQEDKSSATKSVPVAKPKIEVKKNA